MHELVHNMYEKDCIIAVAAEWCKSLFTDLCSKASSSVVAKFSGFAGAVTGLNQATSLVRTLSLTLICQC